MTATTEDLRREVRALGLAGRAVCAHGSLSSFGHVEGGAGAVVSAFLEEGCALLVPAFSSGFEADCERCDDAAAGGPVLREEEG